VVFAGGDEVYEIVIAGQGDYFIGTDVTVLFYEEKVMGKISAVIPGTDCTAIRVACRGA
jgi:hypothetical protein